MVRFRKVFALLRGALLQTTAPAPCLGCSPGEPRSCVLPGGSRGREGEHPAQLRLCLRAERCYSVSSSKTSLAGQVHAASPRVCCTCATRTHNCQRHLNPASPINIFGPFYLILCPFTFLMAFSFSLCRAKTQTALHTLESTGNLFTFKMSSTLQRGNNEDSSVSSTSSGRSVSGTRPFLPASSVCMAPW